MQIGKSSLDVYPLCLGGNTFGWTATVEESRAVLNEYVDAGGNFIDTADVYSEWKEGNAGGESEAIIGDWSKGRGNRADLVIATKVAKLSSAAGLSAANIKKAVDASLKRLNTDYIDLYYAHEEDHSVPVEESIAAFDDLVQAGKIRYVGLSNFASDSIHKWMVLAPERSAPIALQPHYNLVFRAEFEDGLCPVAEQYDLGVMPYFSLAAGLLTGKYQADSPSGARAAAVTRHTSAQSERTVATLTKIAGDHNTEPAAIAIAWLLAQPTVAAPIASARTVSQLPALLEGVTIALEKDELQRLDAVSAGL